MLWVERTGNDMRDHVYLYTIQTFVKPKDITGPSSCVHCQQEVRGRHACLEKQIETFSLWQAAHLLNVSLDDIVYLHKEKVN